MDSVASGTAGPRGLCRAVLLVVSCFQRAGERTSLSAMHLILYGRIVLEILNMIGKVKGFKIFT